MLHTLQANILKSHGRAYAYYLGIRFINSSSPELIRQWIAHLARHQLTSHCKQEEDTLKHKANPSYQASIYTLALSVKGYGTLEIPEALQPKDDLFRLTMVDHGNRDKTILNDYVEDVDNNLEKLDLLLTIAHEDREALERAVAQVKSAPEFKAIEDSFYCKIDDPKEQFEQYSTKLREDGGPLGFVDGLSTPRDFPSVVNATLVKEAGPGDHYGSYMVFRKTDIDEVYFNEVCDKIADEYQVSTEYAAALIVGRFRKGTPLINSETEQPSTEWSEQGRDSPFDYQLDKVGRVCPFAAHVRAMNPRDGEQMEPIIRRSMAYNNEQEGGMLFISYQKSLEKQFLPIVSPNKLVKDNLLYNHEALDFPLFRGDKKTGTVIKLEKMFTTFKGGEYFFCPSIAFLQEIEKLPYA